MDNTTPANIEAANYLTLNQLEQGMPGLTPTAGALLAEASIVCLAHHGKHSQGVELVLAGDHNGSVRVYWDKEISDQILRTYNDSDEAAEFGACGIAILLVLKITPFTVILRSRKGTGFDYWLGYKGVEPPFQEAARLEVSGILRGNRSDIRERVARKLKQTKPSDGSLPAYIVVVEFSKPLSHVVQK